MSRYRVRNWALFAKKYYIYDAYMQCPMLSGQRIADFLLGKNKRIYAEGEDVGDFVVVCNARHIAVKDNSYFWKRIMYPIHTRFGRHRIDQTMEELHQRDPCAVLEKEIRVNIPKGRLRRTFESRLFVYPDARDTIPKKLLGNITDEIKQVMPLHKRLDQFTKEELQTFPKLFDWPEDYNVSTLSPLEVNKHEKK